MICQLVCLQMIETVLSELIRKMKVERTGKEREMRGEKERRRTA